MNLMIINNKIDDQEQWRWYIWTSDCL